MFENLCSRAFSSASNCQFFLRLWLPPKKRDPWNSDRGLYGEEDRGAERARAGESVWGMSRCQTQRSADSSIQWGHLRELPALSHTPAGRPRIYAPGKFFHSMANVLFIWETPRPDCFHNPPDLSHISKRLVKHSVSAQFKNVLPAKTPGNGTTPSADREEPDRRWSCGAVLGSQIYEGKWERIN